MNIEVKQYWTNAIEQIEALNQRERTMILAAILTAFYGVYTYLIEPTLKEQDKLRTAIAQDTTTINDLNLQLTTIVNKNKATPISPEEARINALKEHLFTLEKEVNEVKNMLIRPEKMPDLLGDLLSQNKALTLVSLKTLPIARLFEEDEDQNHSVHDLALPIFKHGVEMTVEGRYLDLLNYVKSIESLPWQLNWDNAALAVDKKPTSPYPLTQLTMTISTLSLDKNWLSI